MLHNTDDYRSFQGVSASGLKKLIKEHGKPSDLEDAQNDSPTVREMLNLAKDYPSVTYHGYVIGKGRDDWRVSVEGFEITGLTSSEAFNLLLEYKGADEVTHSEDGSGHTLYFWWD